MPVNEVVVDSITIANTKVISEAYAAQIAARESEATKHLTRVNVLAEAHLAKVLENSNSVDPVESVAVAKLFSGEANSQIMSILAQLAGGQIGAKTAMTTPPESGVTQLMAQLGALVPLIQQLTKAGQTTPPETGKVA